MSNPFPEWTAQLKSDGLFQVMPAIARGFSHTVIYTPEGDFSDGTFTMQLRASPGAETALATFTCTTGSFADGATPITLSLNVVSQASIPTDADGDGVELLLYDLVYAPPTGAPYPLASGYQPIRGGLPS